jgi:glucose/mannose transport system permease protein
VNARVVAGRTVPGVRGARVATRVGRAPRLSTSRVVAYAILVAFAFFYLMPVYVLLVTGLKPLTEVNLARMWALPSTITLDGFGAAWDKLAPNITNSVLLVIPATLISTAIGSINGYVLAKWRFRGSEVLFTLLLLGMFIPYQSVLIPLVQVLQGMRLYGTLPGLILVHVVYGIPIATLIFRNYYATVPGELLEAASIDGAGLVGIYRSIILPLSAPGAVVVAIWQFTSIWNEFLFAVVVTSNPAVQPITVALNNMAGSFVVEWNVQMAGALLAALPTLLVYLVLGRFFLRGLLAGALKG